MQVFGDLTVIGVVADAVTEPPLSVINGAAQHGVNQPLEVEETLWHKQPDGNLVQNVG